MSKEKKKEKKKVLVRNSYGKLVNLRNESLEYGKDIKTDEMKRIMKTIPFKQSQIEKIYKKLKVEERKVMKDLLEEVDLMEKHKQNVRELKKTMRRIQSYLKWGFDEVDLPIQLTVKTRGGGGKLVKKGGNEYIRGRVHWDGGVDGKGGNREINGLGRITKLVDEINECIRNGEKGFPQKELSEKLTEKYKSMKWEEIQKNQNLMKLLSLLGKKKFRKQLLEQFLSRRTLGYRIRKKDMVSIHKTKEGKKVKDKSTLFSKKYYRDMYFDKTTLNQKTKPNHFEDYMLDILIEEKEERKESNWYKNCVEWLKKEGRWK